jgi:hypothetical protein
MTLVIAAAACARGPTERASDGASPRASAPPSIASDAGDTKAGAAANEAGAGVSATSRCKVEPEGGRLLASGIDLRDVRLAARGGRAAATWVERRPKAGKTELTASAAVLGSDATVQQTRTIATELLEGPTQSRSFLGAVPLVTTSGLALLTCMHAVVSGGFVCTRTTVDDARQATKLPYRSRLSIGPHVAMAAAGLDDGYVVFTAHFAGLAVAS